MNELNQETLRALVDVTNKLVLEVARLRRDVARLHGRIARSEGEMPINDEVPGYEELRFWTLQDALNGLATARRGVIAAQEQLGKSENLLNQIASQSISREEMRPHLKGSK
jgi:hypothetical protein